MILEIIVTTPVTVQLIEKSKVRPNPLTTCNILPENVQIIISININHLNWKCQKHVTIIYKILKFKSPVPNIRKLFVITFFISLSFPLLSTKYLNTLISNSNVINGTNKVT